MCMGRRVVVWVRLRVVRVMTGAAYRTENACSAELRTTPWECRSTVWLSPFRSRSRGSRGRTPRSTLCLCGPGDARNQLNESLSSAGCEARRAERRRGEFKRWGSRRLRRALDDGNVMKALPAAGEMEHVAARSLVAAGRTRRCDREFGFASSVRSNSRLASLLPLWRLAWGADLRGVTCGLVAGGREERGSRPPQRLEGE